ncbi:GNAT family N-acetyltransferase [Demequina gelatinilytica]|uniref:GNAT family N-acetyltransferase n=1 Tax=Demequina gelatinilytica TaxID=1638980 RepID=UPI000B1B4646|nr:GNAT family N-acetyltransferase [Demequina gelatinilytica]
MTWRIPARIETERLVLRPLEGEDDVAAYHASLVAHAEHLRPWMAWAVEEPLPIEKHREWIEQCLAWIAAGGNAYLGVFDRATGAFLGTCGFHATDDPSVREIGYWLGADAEGHGYASEAAIALMAVGLLHARASRVEIRVVPANARSSAVARRCGFTLEGVTAREGEEAMEVWVADVATLTREPAASTPLPRLADAAGATLPWPLWRVPARIETERLVVRRFRNEDAPDVSRVIAANREHLVRFLSWAEDEPRSPEARAAKLAQNIAHHEAGVDFLMGLFDRESGEYLGSAGLHPLDDRPGLEIGYWLSAEHQGRGLMSEAVAALTRVGLSHAGAETVEIYHRPDNTRSAAVPRRLGFADAGLTRDTDDGDEAARWVADRGTLAREPLATAPFPRLEDADGTPIPWEMWDVPPRVETERLVLRRYEPGDLEGMHASILDNLDHLRPFIPWAKHEPLSLAEREEQLAEYRRAFDAGEQFRYAVVDRATGAFIGGAGLHTRVGPDALEIGYWISADREGQGLASEAVRALTRAAFAAGARRAEIWCDLENARSNAVAERCGFAALGARPRGGETLFAWALDAPTAP